MARTDRYGCTTRDEACVIRTFPDRAADAKQALARNANRIEQTRTGTPSQKAKSWRVGRSPGDYDR